MSHTCKKKSLFHIMSQSQSSVGEALIVYFISSSSFNKHKTGSLAEKKGKNPVSVITKAFSEKQLGTQCQILSTSQIVELGRGRSFMLSII